MMGRSVLVALALLASQHADAFVPASFQTATRQAQPHFMAAGDDVTIPYDAAARLAYDEWRGVFDKGDFNDDRYPKFKANYEAITVANIKAKKAAKESGEDSPRMLTLNEFGDMSATEYNEMQAGGSPAPAPAESAPEEEEEDSGGGGGGILGKAVEAAQSQAAAGSALADAADALAEEEEVSDRRVLAINEAVVVTSTHP